MSSEPILKICGMTRVGDALHAVARGRDGDRVRVLEGKSALCRAGAAGEIAAALPATVTTVGVFVNESVDGIRETAETAGLRMVQLHGDEPPDYVEQLEQPVMRVVTLDAIVETARTWPADTTLLLDSADPSRRGAGRAVGGLVACGAGRARPARRAGRRADAGEHRGSDRDRAADRRGCVFGSRVGARREGPRQGRAVSGERARRVRASGEPVTNLDRLRPLSSAGAIRMRAATSVPTAAASCRRRSSRRSRS